RSIFSSALDEDYELFLNRFAITADANDDVVMAEQYCMLGHYECDPDRFSRMRELALGLVRHATGCNDRAALMAMLAAPQNAQSLFGEVADPTHHAGPSTRSAALRAWVAMLQTEDALPFVAAAYQAPALLAQYSFLNPQQIKY